MKAGYRIRLDDAPQLLQLCSCQNSATVQAVREQLCTLGDPDRGDEHGIRKDRLIAPISSCTFLDLSP